MKRACDDAVGPHLRPHTEMRHGDSTGPTSVTPLHNEQILRPRSRAMTKDTHAWPGKYLGTGRCLTFPATQGATELFCFSSGCDWRASKNSACRVLGRSWWVQTKTEKCKCH
jgi:hypothetical protein